MSLLVPLSAFRPWRTAAAGVFVHDFFEGETLLLDLARAWRLSRLDLADLDATVALTERAQRHRGDALHHPEPHRKSGHDAESLLDQTLAAGRDPPQHSASFPTRKLRL
ncbi:MAG: hypothetical protein HPM95_07035 [Alphaproteobacteria bacterium]|nr:hypothetical protein [Alphaproteobacteria bacterium]